MDDKIKGLLTEMAQAASYFGRKAKEIGLDPNNIESLVFSGDGYLNCEIAHNGIKYEAIRTSGGKDTEYRMKFPEELEEVEDDLPFC